MFGIGQLTPTEMAIIDHESTIISTWTVLQRIDCKNVETDTYEQPQTCDS
jgi:hypothetical protein